jgi:hypothetical protein
MIIGKERRKAAVRENGQILGEMFLMKYTATRWDAS